MIQDLIKQPRIFFNCEDQESYSIDDFCDDKELLLIHREFLNADIKSYNGKIHQLAHPIHNPVIGEIIKPKIKKIFPNAVYYSDVSNDPINVGDQLYITYTPYSMHTDCAVHIDGYKPFKDVIIPIAMSDEKEIHYFTCNQRYKSRAAFFNRGRSSNYIPNGSDVLREHAYEYYGVENVEYGEDMSWALENGPSWVEPISYEGLSIEKIFPWVPGNAIVNDSCVLHSGSDFRKKSVEWKIGLTLHLLTKV
jgi:hypothetical protein